MALKRLMVRALDVSITRAPVGQSLAGQVVQFIIGASTALRVSIADRAGNPRTDSVHVAVTSGRQRSPARL